MAPSARRRCVKTLTGCDVVAIFSGAGVDRGVRRKQHGARASVQPSPHARAAVRSLDQAFPASCSSSAAASGGTLKLVPWRAAASASRMGGQAPPTSGSKRRFSRRAEARVTAEPSLGAGNDASAPLSSNAAPRRATSGGRRLKSLAHDVRRKDEASADRSRVRFPFGVAGRSVERSGCHV